MNIKSLLPPILVDLALAATRSRHGFTGQYQSYDQALEGCTSYEDSSLIEQYKSNLEEKLENGFNSSKFIDDRSARILAAISIATLDLGANSKNIIDFGGAWGNHFFDSLGPIRKNIRNYVVCESPSVAEALGKISSPINFESELEKFENEYFDIALASCVLPYLQNPYESLEKLAEISKWIVLDRMPILSELDRDIVTVQHTFAKNGTKLSYPAIFFSEKNLRNELSRLNLEIISEWKVPEDRPYFRGKREPYVGWLLKKVN